MNSFDNREKAEENKYAHEREVEFIVNARFHKLLALWVAEKLGFDVEKTRDYTNTLVTSDVEMLANEKLLHKVQHDLLIHNANMNEHELKEVFYNLQAEAKLQIHGNG